MENLRAYAATYNGRWSEVNPCMPCGVRNPTRLISEWTSASLKLKVGVPNTDD